MKKTTTFFKAMEYVARGSCNGNLKYNVREKKALS